MLPDNYVSLIYYAQVGNLDLVTQLKKYYGQGPVGYTSKTALQYAIQNKHYDCAKVLMTNTIERNGKTLLIVAAMINDVYMVRRYKNRMARKSFYNMTAL